MWKKKAPSVNAVIENKYSGKYFGAGSALVNSCYSIASIVGPIAMSAITNIASPEASFLSVSGVLVVLTVLFWTQRRGLKKASESVKFTGESEVEIPLLQSESGDEIPV